MANDPQLEAILSEIRTLNSRLSNINALKANDSSTPSRPDNSPLILPSSEKFSAINRNPGQYMPSQQQGQNVLSATDLRSLNQNLSGLKGSIDELRKAFSTFSTDQKDLRRSMESLTQETKKNSGGGARDNSTNPATGTNTQTSGLISALNDFIRAFRTGSSGNPYGLSGAQQTPLLTSIEGMFGRRGGIGGIGGARGMARMFGGGGGGGGAAVEGEAAAAGGASSAMGAAGAAGAILGVLNKLTGFTDGLMTALKNMPGPQRASSDYANSIQATIGTSVQASDFGRRMGFRGDSYDAYRTIREQTSAYGVNSQQTLALGNQMQNQRMMFGNRDDIQRTMAGGIESQQGFARAYGLNVQQVATQQNQQANMGIDPDKFATTLAIAIQRSNAGAASGQMTEQLQQMLTIMQATSVSGAGKQADSLAEYATAAYQAGSPQQVQGAMQAGTSLLAEGHQRGNTLNSMLFSQGLSQGMGYGGARKFAASANQSDIYGAMQGMLGKDFANDEDRRAIAAEQFNIPYEQMDEFVKAAQRQQSFTPDQRKQVSDLQGQFQNGQQAGPGTRLITEATANDQQGKQDVYDFLKQQNPDFLTKQGVGSAADVQDASKLLSQFGQDYQQQNPGKKFDLNATNQSSPENLQNAQAAMENHFEESARSMIDTYTKLTQDEDAAVGGFAKTINGAVETAGKGIDEFTSAVKSFGDIIEGLKDADGKEIKNGAKELGSVLAPDGLSFNKDVLTNPGKAFKDALHGMHIPGFATGTGSAPPGMIEVGESGPEFISGVGGATIDSHGQSLSMTGQYATEAGQKQIIELLQQVYISLQKQEPENVAFATPQSVMMAQQQQSQGFIGPIQTGVSGGSPSFSGGGGGSSGGNTGGGGTGGGLDGRKASDVTSAGANGPDISWAGAGQPKAATGGNGNGSATGGGGNATGAAAPGASPLTKAIYAATDDPAVRMAMLTGSALEGEPNNGPFIDQIGGGPGRGPYQIEAGPGGSHDLKTHPAGPGGGLSVADANDPTKATAFMLNSYQQGVARARRQHPGLEQSNPAQFYAIAANNAEGPANMYPDERIGPAYAQAQSAAAQASGGANTSSTSGNPSAVNGMPTKGQFQGFMARAYSQVGKTNDRTYDSFGNTSIDKDPNSWYYLCEAFVEASLQNQGLIQRTGESTGKFDNAQQSRDYYKAQGALRDITDPNNVPAGAIVYGTGSDPNHTGFATGSNGQYVSAGMGKAIQTRSLQGDQMTVMRAPDGYKFSADGKSIVPIDPSNPKTPPIVVPNAVTNDTPPVTTSDATSSIPGQTESTVRTLSVDANAPTGDDGLVRYQGPGGTYIYDQKNQTVTEPNGTKRPVVTGPGHTNATGVDTTYYHYDPATGKLVPPTNTPTGMPSAGVSGVYDPTTGTLVPPASTPPANTPAVSTPAAATTSGRSNPAGRIASSVGNAIGLNILNPSLRGVSPVTGTTAPAVNSPTGSPITDLASNAPTPPPPMAWNSGQPLDNAITMEDVTNRPYAPPIAQVPGISLNDDDINASLTGLQPSDSDATAQSRARQQARFTDVSDTGPDALNPMSRNDYYSQNMSNRTGLTYEEWYKQQMGYAVPGSGGDTGAARVLSAAGNTIKDTTADVAGAVGGTAKNAAGTVLGAAGRGLSFLGGKAKSATVAVAKETGSVVSDAWDNAWHGDSSPPSNGFVGPIAPASGVTSLFDTNNPTVQNFLRELASTMTEATANGVNKGMPSGIFGQGPNGGGMAAPAGNGTVGSMASHHWVVPPPASAQHPAVATPTSPAGTDAPTVPTGNNTSAPYSESAAQGGDYARSGRPY